MKRFDTLGMAYAGLVVALASSVATGCANDGVDVLAGGTTGDAQGGSSSAGGAGGSVSTGGSGEGGSASLCEQDCSEIEAPSCYVAVCNDGAYAGQIGACVVVPAETGTRCDDGLFCTVNDTCDEGTCVGGPQNDCGLEPAPCTQVACDEASQSCGEAPAENGAPCISSSLCEVNATCQNGLCVGAPKDCSFSPLSECNQVTCSPATGACEPTPDATKNGSSCSLTGDLCMVGKTCSAGQCLGGSPKDCSALSVNCNNGVCNPVNGNCQQEPLMPGEMCLDAVDECNTGVCSMGGTCDPVPTPGVSCPSAVDECNVGSCDAGGACQPVPTPGVACASMADQCNTATCNASGVCTAAPVPNGTLCNDGNSCTIGDACNAGVCTGTPDPGYAVYFSETFQSNAAGWTLGPEWQIGPAAASSGHIYGNADPALDHTATADNGVAGVVIGGNASTTLHGYYYLTSPVLDTSSAPGNVWLEFWRWLNSDYTPYMKNVVEVYTGSQWVVVWESLGSPGVQDNAWVKQSFNLTAYKNPSMQVRFGFQIGSSGVFTVSSWNVDDVTIASAPCN